MLLKLFFFSLPTIVIVQCQSLNHDPISDSAPELKPVASYELDIIEPSDLYYDATEKILLTVSDCKSKIYKISFTGVILSDIETDITNMEGICYGKNRSMCVVDELARSVMVTDSMGKTISLYEISIPVEDANSGLEGIAYAPFNDHYYLINEQNPDLLIETDSEFSQLATYHLSFAEDYSGICVDNKNRHLWIVSDISETITRCDMKGNPIATFNISVKNVEGIAYNPETKDLYLVSDSKSKLYLYSLKNLL